MSRLAPDGKHSVPEVSIGNGPRPIRRILPGWMLQVDLRARSVCTTCLSPALKTMFAVRSKVHSRYLLPYAGEKLLWRRTLTLLRKMSCFGRSIAFNRRILFCQKVWRRAASSNFQNPQPCGREPHISAALFCPKNLVLALS